MDQNFLKYVLVDSISGFINCQKIWNRYIGNLPARNQKKQFVSFCFNRSSFFVFFLFFLFFRKLVFCLRIFAIYYFVAPWPILGHFQGDSLADSMSITLFLDDFWLKSYRKSCNEVVCLSPAEEPVWFEPAVFWF